MSIELRHLRCFLAIAEESSMTRAAAKLRITQPAVSRSLATLERHLGVRLVDRSTHHVTLTPEGRAFRERAASAVGAFDDALASAGRPVRPLRLGHAWAALGAWTTPLLRRWKHEHPDVPLELLRFDDRTAGLSRGAVDVAVVRGPVAAPGLVVTPLFSEPRVAAVTADGPFAALPELTLADLATAPLLVNTVSGVTVPELWPPDARPGTTITVTNTDDWLASIAAGRGVGVSVASTAEIHPHPDVVYRTLPELPMVLVRLAHRAPPSHPAVPDLVALAVEVTRRPPATGAPATAGGPAADPGGH